MNTARIFKAVYHIKGASLHEMDIALDELCKSLPSEQCLEIYYAIDEVMDNVLDMKVGDSLYFTPNRDCKQSKGILIRIN